MLETEAHWWLGGAAFDLWHRTQLDLLELGHRQGTLHSRILSVFTVRRCQSIRILGIRNMKRAIWQIQLWMHRGDLQLSAWRAGDSGDLGLGLRSTTDWLARETRRKTRPPHHQTTELRRDNGNHIESKARVVQHLLRANPKPKDRLQSLSQSAIQSLSQLVSESGVQFEPS